MKSFSKFSFIFFLALIPLLAFAQKDSTSTPQPNKPKSPLSDRIFIGGNAALSFGTITLVGASPVIGYRLNDNWLVGVGGSYYYYRDNYYNYSNSIYGGLLLTRYIIYKGIYLEGDFEENNQEALTIVDPIQGTFTLSRKWIPSLLVGAGYSQNIGGRSAFFVSILYDVIQNPNSQYYRIPVVRAGFGFGL